MSEAMEELREFLDDLEPGEIDSDTKEKNKILSLLQEAWPSFPGPKRHKTTVQKLSRMESLSWDPPELSFDIERHGGTVEGSTRASIFTWTLNLEEGSLSREKTGYRQVKPQQSPWYAEEGAKEIVELILSGTKDDDRIEWRGDNKVKILKREIIPNYYHLVDQTRERRRKRLYEELTEALEPHGWSRNGTSAFYEKEE